VDQEESIRNEASKVFARPPKRAKDLKEASPQLVRRVGVEVASIDRWGDPDEENAHGSVA
jgi:hypothetical protein